MGEKKSLEGGGNLLSTTSKNLLVHKKTGIPIRFYDAKGAENKENVKNYINLLKDFGSKNISYDSIHNIFYCVPYEKNGTLFQEMEYELFEVLIDLNIYINFIITKSPYDPYKKIENQELQENREEEGEKIKNCINNLINDAFEKKNKKIEAQNFIDKYVNINFVNLVRDNTNEIPVPVFGIDKVLSYFKNSIKEEEWNELKKVCKMRNEKKCKELCENIPYLRMCSDFTKLNKKNKEEAENYLKGLKTKAFFSGMVPFFDMGFEYIYRYKFLKKLKTLYGFDYEEAKKVLNITDSLIKNNFDNEEQNNKLLNDETINNLESKEINTSFNNDKYDLNSTIILDKEDLEKKMENIKREEEETTSKIKDNINNAGKNTISIVRAIAETGGIFARLAIETGLSFVKVISWTALPVITLVPFGFLSRSKINSDCKKMIAIFEKAFTPLRFDTLYNYIKSFIKAFDDLDLIGKKIVEDDKPKNENNLK